MNQSKPIVPYGKRASVLATLKMILVLALGGANSVRYGILWLLFKKRRVQSLRLYMFAAASRTLLHLMRADDIQMLVGLRALSAELNMPFYRSLTKKALGFNSTLDTSVSKIGAKIAPGIHAPSCVWLWQVEDRKPEDPVIFFIHGGAYALGMSFSQVYWVTDLVKALPQHRISVLALDYSLSPYAKYPTQLHEAIVGYESLAESCNRIITLGDSAGGSLSTALALSLKDYPDLLAKLYGQVYVSPWAELLPSQDGSVKKNDQSDWVTNQFAARCAGWYLGEEIFEVDGVVKTANTDPKADIKHATAEQLRQVLPTNTACVWSANELLADAIERFCKKANITETCIEQAHIHDVLYFGNDNDSTRFILGVLNRWLNTPSAKPAAKAEKLPSADAAKRAEPTPVLAKANVSAVKNN